MGRKAHIDWLLFLTVVGMVSLGLVMVYSASSVMAELRYNQDSSYFAVRQAAACAVSFLALTLLSRHDYRRLRSPQWAFAALGIVIFLLIVVFFVDGTTHRWFRLRFTSIQPSEFAKPALIIFLAWFVTPRAHDVNSRYTVWPAGLALGMLTICVGLGDVGTITVLAATAAAIFYLAGLNRRYTLIALGTAVVVLSLLVLYKPYRLKRVLDFVDPEYKYLVYLDPGKAVLHYAQRGSSVQDMGYQALQSKIAVGAGGISGEGLMQSKQKLLFLPEAHTDFIYAIVAEELGLWGSLAVLAGFVVILWRGYRLYWTAADDFGRYIAVGVTTSIVFQALLNMSVVLDMGPTKGIPLPLISYGGSSLLSSMVCLGLLLSVSERAS